ncbi:hypothetical protein PR048_001946, partial [Dryococelus australis]
MVVDTATETVLSVTCEDCPASQGGCKHGVGFLMLVHRRSEEPSPTSVECYWKKSVLSSVGSSIKFVFQNLPQKFLIHFYSNSKKDHNITHLKHITEEKNPSLSLQVLLHNFVHVNENSVNQELFLQFCSQTTYSDFCSLAVKNTLRYGNITASKLYEVAHCYSFDGSLVEKILVFGASPDALGKDYVVEIKCSASLKSKTLYIRRYGEVKPKHKAQMNLQMLLCNKKKAICG